MRTITAQDADKNFTKLLQEVEEGEVLVITREGRTVAQLRPIAGDPWRDPEWRGSFDRMKAQMAKWPDAGLIIGRITAADKYGEAS